MLSICGKLSYRMPVLSGGTPVLQMIQAAQVAFVIANKFRTASSSVRQDGFCFSRFKNPSV